MNTKEWYRAHIRWAVMVEGKGLHRWEDSIYMFLSSDHITAFQHALRIGQGRESYHIEDQQAVVRRFAEVVQVDGCGIDLKEIEVYWWAHKPEKPLPFNHVFTPEETAPPYSVS